MLFISFLYSPWVVVLQRYLLKAQLKLKLKANPMANFANAARGSCLAIFSPSCLILSFEDFPFSLGSYIFCYVNCVGQLDIYFGRPISIILLVAFCNPKSIAI